MAHSLLARRIFNKLAATHEIFPYAMLRATRRLDRALHPQTQVPNSAARNLLTAIDFGSVRHVERTLEAHLLGTYRILAAWGNPEAVCLAGLFHAAYGTETLSTQLVNLDRRALLQEALGTEVETLVYYYSLLDRSQLVPACEGNRFYIRLRTTGEMIGLSHQEFAQLTEIFLADRLEQLFELNYRRRDQFNRFFNRAYPLLSPKARAEYRLAFRKSLPVEFAGQCEKTRTVR